MEPVQSTRLYQYVVSLVILGMDPLRRTSNPARQGAHQLTRRTRVWLRRYMVCVFPGALPAAFTGNNLCAVSWMNGSRSVTMVILRTQHAASPPGHRCRPGEINEFLEDSRRTFPGPKPMLLFDCVFSEQISNLSVELADERHVHERWSPGLGLGPGLFD